jgi:putative ABC transport system permease protein
MSFLREIKYAFRSLARARGLTFTVILTLALGIGGNAAIFTLVRGVLLRPLVNRDENRLIYIRQSAPALRVENTTFSVPEIQDLKSRVTAVSAFGDFSTIGFTMVGLGEPREVRAGVVGGSYFSVMGLSPVLGRLLGPGDDGPSAAGAAVLTWRFWSTALHSDPSVVGRTIRLGTRSATIVGVLEPCVPYPAETEIIANVVTSPHHLSATMVQGRIHRMTELFGRLAPGATVESARADLRAAYASMVQQHPEAYDQKGGSRIDAMLLRDEISSKARTVLLVLLAASGLLFVIACSNVANLVLARSMRREGELAIRQALGAGTAALRRTLLAESLLLCGAGAAVGLLIARPMVAVLARYAARFSVRALDLTFDPSMVWAAAALAMVAAVLLAFVPRLPSGAAAGGIGRGTGSPRVTGGSSRRLQVFAVTQIAASFILLVGATMLLKTLVAMQSAETGLDTRHVLVLNVPIMSYGRSPEQVINFYSEAVRRVRELPSVDQVALGTQAPWRDAGSFGPGFEFSVDGYVPAPGEQKPRAQFRIVSPSFFAALGAPLLAGRDFNDLDRTSGESVVIVSQSLARRMFPSGDAVNHHLALTDPIMKFIGVEAGPRRIVGVVADVDDEHVVPGPIQTVYNPFGKEMTFAGRMFVHVHGDPYGLVAPIQKIIRGMSAEQPVERAATLADIRAEVLTPDRLNTVVFGVFAAVALAIALVGVAGVLAFSVSARMKEFGIRLAIGSDPRALVAGVIRKGLVIAAVGLVAGAGAGFALERLAAAWFPVVKPGAMPITGAALVLLAAAIVASWVPARRAGRVDVIQVLRSE